MAANRIVLVVDFQSQNATNSINTLNQGIGQIGTTAQKAGAQGSAGIKGFTLAIDQASRSVGTLMASLTGLGIAAATREWLGLSDTMLKAQFALTAAFGPETASMIQQQMRSLAHEAGLSQAALLKNAQTLGAVFRVPAEQIPGLMKVLVDFTRSLGQGQEQLDNMVTLFGTMLAKGFITARELYNKFTAAGIPALDVLMKALGKTRIEMTKLLKENEQDVRVFATDILSAMQSMSSGAAAKFAASIPSAMFEQAMDQLRDLALKAFVAMQPEIQAVIEGLKTMIATVVGLTKAFREADEPTKTFIKDMAALVGILLVLPTAITVVTSVWKTLIGIFTAVSTVIRGLVAAWGLLAGAMETIAEIAAIAFAALELPAAVLAGIIALILTLVGLALKFNVFPPIITALGNAWEWAKKKVEGFTQSVKDGYVAMMKFVGLGGTGTGVGENVEEHRRAVEESQQSLYEAEQRNLKAGLEGIAALDLAYQEHLIKAKGYIDAEANYRLELAVEIDTEIKKREEEASKAAVKNAQELSRLHRQVAIAAAEVIPDSTYAGQSQLAAMKAQAHREEMAEDARIQIQQINEQLARDKAGAIAEGQIAKQNAYEINRNVQRLNETAQTQRVAINDKANAAIMEHDLQAAKELNQLRLEQEQQYRDQRLADELDMIQKQSQLTIAYMRADDAQTMTARVNQIQAIEDEQEQSIALTRRAQLTAAQEAFDAYKNAHADFAAGVEEEARKLARTQVQIERDASAQIQMDRLESWRTTNEVIIEEQKKVYEGMKSTIDKIWDALTGKGKSAWEAIGNAIKTAIGGAIKEMVTSRVAGSLTEAITGRSVTFPGGVRRFFGNAPEFQGAGPRPELQPLGPAIDSTFKPLVLAGTDLSTAAGLLVNSASALTAAAGAIVAGGAGGGADASAVQSAVQSVQSAQTQGQLGAASMSNAAVTSAATPTGISAPSLPSGGGWGPGGMPPAVTGVYQPDADLLSRATGGAPISSATPSLPTAANVNARANMAKLFGIGQPVTLSSGAQIPWASASPTQKFGAILQSQGAAQVGMSMGAALALSGLGRNTPGGRAQTIAGATLAGVSASRMFPGVFGDLGPTGGAIAGAALGLGVGVAAAGLQRGGKLGFGMSVGGGALAGAALGSIFPGLGTLAGAAIGAAVGAVAGGIRLLFPTLMERVPKEIKRVYGVSIQEPAIIKQIADIISQKYGGSLSVGIYSQEVQDIVRLYAISSGQSQAGLPRQMYGATFAQSQSGGLQVQPVYSGGQLIQNPYVGTTTTQFANALASRNSLYMQLNPQQATQLFAGQVVKVLGDNPGTVAAANTSAARSGTNRTTQGSALMEPLTVTR